MREAGHGALVEEGGVAELSHSIGGRLCAGSVRLSCRFGDMLAEERWRTEGSAGSCSIGP